MPALHRVFRDEKFGLYAMVFLTNLGWSITSPLLPDIQAEFGVTVATVALVNSVYGFARLILNLPVGLILDRVDQRLLRLAGATILCAGSILCAVAVTFPMLLLGRLVSGLGGAIILVTNLVWISRLSTNERRGWDLGVYQAIFQAGVSVSPMVGGVLAYWGNWRTAFWFAAVTSLLAFLPMFGGRTEWLNRVDRKNIDPERPGAAKTEAGWQATTLSALFVANLITFVLFFTAGGFQNTLIPLYGGLVLGLDTATIGLALGLSTIVRFGTSLIGGSLSDRFGRRVILVPGLILMGLGMLMLNLASNLVTYWLTILVFSIGRFGGNVPATVLADHAPPARWGFLMGLNRFVGDLGVVLGPLVTGLLLEHYGYQPTVILTAAIVWLSTLAVIIGVTEVRPRQPIMGWVRKRKV